MLRILFLSDTHIGFDWPQKPKISRRRRGDDFWNNFLLALEPAFKNEVDLVVHGGDLLYRSRVPGSLVIQALEPLQKIAASGIPVYIVPGNHERSNLRRTLFDAYPNLHIFHEPACFTFEKEGKLISIAGFPFVRDNIRSTVPVIFRTIRNDYQSNHDFRIICIHHPVDGAKVGPDEFKFINQPDTIDIAQVTSEFDLVLAGHIHRHQILNDKTVGKSEGALVIFAGSVERTSFRERSEEKGYCIIELDNDNQSNLKLKNVHFKVLPARPMHIIQVDISTFNKASWKKYLANIKNKYAFDSVLRLDLEGIVPKELLPMLKNKFIRQMTPSSMNIKIKWRKQ